MVALLSVAAVRVRSPMMPGSIALAAAVLAMMLLTKPGTGAPEPDLTDGGRAGLALVICAVVVGVVHAAHLTLAPR